MSQADLATTTQLLDVGNVSSKLGLILNSQKLSDIKLEFPNENRTLYAHKVILSVHSNVFDMIFDGPLASKNDAIQINDCSADDFMEVLRFCYTNKFALNHTNVSQILHAANYYNIIDLEEHCCDFVLKDLNFVNVCEIYDKYFMYVNKLTEKCWRIFDDNISAIFCQENFLCLSKPALKVLLKRDSLTCNEFELFKAVRYWAENEIEKNDTSLETLGDVFELIRFPTMTISDFLVCGGFDYSLLSPQDFKDIKHYIKTGELNSMLEYSTIHRETYIDDEVEFPDTECLYASDPPYPPKEENMVFTVMTKIKIKSFKFITHEKCRYGSVNYGIELSTVNGKILYKYEGATPIIDCNELILLTPDIHYKLTSWQNHFVSNNLRFRSHGDCNLVYSIFRKFDGVTDDDDNDDDNDDDDDGNDEPQEEEADSVDYSGPFVITHQDDERFNFPVNKTYLSNISFKILK